MDIQGGLFGAIRLRSSSRNQTHIHTTYHKERVDFGRVKHCCFTLNNIFVNCLKMKTAKKYY